MNNKILYLTDNTSEDLRNLSHSLSSLQENYLNQYPCDIIILHESLSLTSQYLLSSLVKVKIQFISVDFSDTFGITPLYHLDKGNLGYRHMCRLFSGAVFTRTELQNIDYVWRIDTDGFILSPIKYNVFDAMIIQRIPPSMSCYIYGYLGTHKHMKATSENLWKTVLEYADYKNIVVNFDWEAEGRTCYRTNFEIMYAPYFCDTEYQEFFHYLDRTGNFLRYRWGDHMVRYIAAKLFKLSTLQLPNVHYKHQDFTC